MQRLLLRMGPGPDQQVEWAIGSGAELERSGSVPSLEALPDSLRAAEEIVVVLRGDRAATRRLLLPVRRDGALEAAARLAFEDVLATPAEECHFAFGPADAQGYRRVSAVPADWFAAWMAGFEEAGIDPDLVTLDHLALAGEQGEGVVLHDRYGMVVRLPEGGMTTDMEFAEYLLADLEGHDEALKLSVAGRKPLGGPVLADQRALGAFYFASLDRETPPSFLLGAYRRRADWFGQVREWRAPAALAAACLVVWLAALLADGIRHQAGADDLRDEARQLFTEAYPDVPVRNLSRQAAVRAGQGGAPLFLPLSVALAEEMEGSESLELTGLRYEAGEGLVADLRFPDAAAIEALKEKLNARGVITEEGGSLRRDDDGRFAGQLLLRGMS